MLYAMLSMCGPDNLAPSIVSLAVRGIAFLPMPIATSGKKSSKDFKSASLVNGKGSYAEFAKQIF